jgi:hypothetical protein
VIYLPYKNNFKVGDRVRVIGTDKSYFQRCWHIEYKIVDMNVGTTGFPIHLKAVIGRSEKNVKEDEIELWFTNFLVDL